MNFPSSDMLTCGHIFLRFAESKTTIKFPTVIGLALSNYYFLQVNVFKCFVTNFFQNVLNITTSSSKDAKGLKARNTFFFFTLFCFAKKQPGRGMRIEVTICIQNC